jgi:hypothetical protein
VTFVPSHPLISLAPHLQNSYPKYKESSVQPVTHRPEQSFSISGDKERPQPPDLDLGSQVIQRGNLTALRQLVAAHQPRVEPAPRLDEALWNQMPTPNPRRIKCGGPTPVVDVVNTAKNKKKSLFQTAPLEKHEISPAASILESNSPPQPL